MAVSKSYREFVHETLSAVAEIRMQSMFGGVGISHEDDFFALIADDVLYFRTDDKTRARYEDLGMGQFSPGKGKGMPYHEVPAEALEDVELLAELMEEATLAARRNKKTKKTKKG